MSLAAAGYTKGRAAAAGICGECAEATSLAYRTAHASTGHAGMGQGAPGLSARARDVGHKVSSNTPTDALPS